MAAYPELVRMEAFDEWQGPLPQWLEDAQKARKDEGQRWMRFCVNGWISELEKNERHLK
jgi:hypothetical protein